MSTVELKLTEGQINNAIAIAIAEAFTPEKKDSLIRDIIRQHLTIKQDHYSKDTLFSHSVNKVIGVMVKEELDKQVEALRPEVEEMVKEVFGGKVKINIIEQLKYSLKKVALDNISVSVTVGKDDY